MIANMIPMENLSTSMIEQRQQLIRMKIARDYPYADSDWLICTEESPGKWVPLEDYWFSHFEEYPADWWEK